MKSFVTSLLIMLLSTTVSSQHPPTAKQLTKQDYLHKSKTQRTVAWVLLASGTTTTLVGIIVARNSPPPPGSSLFETTRGEDVGITLAILGLTADLISIPLFISSVNNAEKAATLHFRRQEIAFPLANRSLRIAQPSITFRVSF